MLDMLAANKTAVMSYHFAWPGYGHVVKAGDGLPLYRGANDHEPVSARNAGDNPAAVDAAGLSSNRSAPAGKPPVSAEMPALWMRNVLRPAFLAAVERGICP